MQLVIGSNMVASSSGPWRGAELLERLYLAFPMRRPEWITVLTGHACRAILLASNREACHASAEPSSFRGEVADRYRGGPVPGCRRVGRGGGTVRARGYRAAGAAGRQLPRHRGRLHVDPRRRDRRAAGRLGPGGPG